MKRSRLTYDEWSCILSKKMVGKQVKSDAFKGYLGLIEIEQVSEPQIWKFNGEEIVVCDSGIKWLSILPGDDFFCITAMLNDKEEILLWYIDMIARQGVGGDGVPWFDDLYLDLVVYPDGTILTDDMDELEEALEKGDISLPQFELALETSERLRKGLLSDIRNFIAFTEDCLASVKDDMC